MPKTRRVLIALADPLFREALAAELRRLGLDVVAVRDGQEAVEKVRDEAPDHVVADVHLSRLSGLDLWRSLKGTSVTLLVEPGDTQAEADLRRLGASHLVKRGEAAALAAELRSRLVAGTLVRDLKGDIDREARRIRDREALVELAGGERELLEQAILEPVTRLHSPAYLRRRLEEEWIRSRALGTVCALAVLAPDGGGAGDLKALEQAWAGLLLAEAPAEDLLFREGECRFAALFPAADRPAAERHAVLLRRLCRDEGAGDGPAGAPRVSAGLVILPHRLMMAWEEALARAGEALRAAQALGGDRVCVWEGVREIPEEAPPG